MNEWFSFDVLNAEMNSGLALYSRYSEIIVSKEWMFLLTILYTAAMAEDKGMTAY